MIYHGGGYAPRQRAGLDGHQACTASKCRKWPFATVGQALAQVLAAAARLRRRRTAPESAGRNCEHCGAVFVPQREHARFCSWECRAAWNREHLGDPAVEASALAWSLAAMSEATGRLPAVRVWDQELALGAIGQAVWWITMVDATLVRHHPGGL